jgi:hypothetical protein
VNIEGQVSFWLDDLVAKSKQRPAGYVDHVLSLATHVVGGRVWLRAADHDYLVNLYRKPLPEPKLTELAHRAGRAFLAWAKAGFPVADERTIKHRRAACLNCQWWNGEARGGLGKCAHAKCGCTKLKWWLATEKCPDGRWRL